VSSSGVDVGLLADLVSSGGGRSRFSSQHPQTSSCIAGRSVSEDTKIRRYAFVGEKKFDRENFGSWSYRLSAGWLVGRC
jgi:hypothetical protein